METETSDAAVPLERNKAGMFTGVGKLSWPLILAYLGQDLLRIIDHVMLGNYDPTVLAGVGIAGGVMWMHFAIGIGLAGAADTLIAQSVGAEKPGQTRWIFSATKRTIFLASLPLMLSMAAAGFLYHPFGVADDVATAARAYTIGRAPSLVIMFMFFAYRSLLQATENPRPLKTVTIWSNVANVPLNGLLIWGDGALEVVGLPGIGLPELGAWGAAGGTTIIQAGALVYLQRHARRGLKTDRPPEDPGYRVGRSLLRVGIPLSFQMLVMIWLAVTLGIMAGRMGELESTAFQVQMSLFGFLMEIAWAVGAAVAVQMGLALGAKRFDDFWQVTVTGLVVVQVALAPFVGSYLLYPELYTMILGIEGAPRAATLPLFIWSALLLSIVGLQQVAVGGLRGLMITRPIPVTQIVCGIGLGLPVALYLGLACDMGPRGLLIGIIAGEFSAGAVFLLILWRACQRDWIGERVYPNKG